METVLITGYNGFIGSHLVPELQNNFRIIGISTSKTPKLRIQQIKKDITKITSQDIPHKISYIIHLAAMSDVDFCEEHPHKAFLINVYGTQQVLEIARKKNSNLLFMSTSHVFGSPKTSTINEVYHKDPQSIYAATKLEGEILCKSYANSYGLNIDIARLFSLYGPNNPQHSVVNSIIQQILTRQTITLGSTKTKRDFLFIKDAVKAILLIMKKNHGFNDYNIGTGKSSSIMDVCSILKKISQKEIPIKSVNSKIRKKDAFQLISDSNKIKKLGWNPTTTLYHGLRTTYEWYKSNSTKI